jgi:hypothetical protein
MPFAIAGIMDPTLAAAVVVSASAVVLGISLRPSKPGTRA